MSTGAADHERLNADVAAYALGVLGAEEARALRSHLAACALCRDELFMLQPAVDALAMAAPPAPAPPALKDRLMGVVGREAELLRAAGPDADRAARTPRRLSLRRPRGVAGPVLAGTGLAATGLAAGALLFSGGSSSQLRPASVAQALGPGVHASLRVGSGRAQLQVSDMPNPPAGRVWQLWLKRDGRAPEPGPVFELRSGTVSLPAAGPHGSLVLVTDEPPAGSAAPSTEPVIAARL